MADTWRRQRVAAWDVLLDFDHSTIATYAYLATGPAATRTGCLRLHRRRLRRELGLKGTQLDAVLADLCACGLLVVATDGEVLSLYLRGVLVDCPPSNPNMRRGFIREIRAGGENEATAAALADLGATGGCDLQVVEHTGGRLSTVAQHSPKVVAEKEKEKENNYLVASAPETPARGWQEQPWAPIVHAYREHLPHRPQPRDATLNAKLGRHLAKRWQEQPDADWWSRLLKCCAGDDWYSGRGSWAGVSLAWLSTPNGLQKATDKFHATMTGAQARSRYVPSKFGFAE